MKRGLIAKEETGYVIIGPVLEHVLRVEVVVDLTGSRLNHGLKPTPS